MKRRKIYGAISNLGLVTGAVSALSYLNVIKKCTTVQTEEEFEKLIKKSKVLGTVSGVSLATAGVTGVLDVLSYDKLENEEVDLIVEKVKEELNKEIDAEEEEEDVEEEIIIDDESIEI